MNPSSMFPHTLPRPCRISGGAPCEACSSLSELDAKIAQNQVAEPLAARLASLSKVNERHDPMASVFPVEITTKIFHDFLPDIPPPELLLGREEQDGLDQLFPQRRHILTSVCQNWRNIAITSPSLWSSLFLNIDQTKSAAHMKTILRDISRSFARSADSSLVIRLQIYRYNSISLRIPFTSVLKVMEMVCKQGHRWKTLCIKAPPMILKTISQYTSELTKGSPRLSSLILYNDAREEEKTLSVSIGSPTTPFASPTYIWTRNITLTPTTVDFAQLTDLQYHFPTASELVQVLALSPQLRSLRCGIASDISRRGYHAPTTSAHDQDVQTLNFELEHPIMKSWQVQINYSGVFPRFTFPSLEHLDYVHPGPLALAAIHDFLARSHCPLTTLRLVIRCEEAEFIDLLRLTPNLRKLTTSTNSLSSEFFKHLQDTVTTAQSTNEATFLPRLQNFQFHAEQVSYLTFDWSLLRMMYPTKTGHLKSRPLSKVIISMHPVQVGNLASKSQSDLVSVIDDGLEIVVYYTDADPKVNILESFEPLEQALARLHRACI